MFPHYFPAYPRLANHRRITAPVHHGMPEITGDLPVLFPPCPYRIHVMSRCSADGIVRIMCRISEHVPGRFRHSLYLKRKYAVFIHDLLHTVRHHTQILSAGKHSGSGKKRRQLAHGRFLPEGIVPVIEKVIIKPVESLLVPIIQLRIGVRKLRRNPRMPPSFPVRIFHKQDILSIIMDLPARNPGHMETHPLQFIGRIWKRRIEMPQKSAFSRHGNLPYPEKSQYMIYPEHVEILRHALHPGFPPCIPVLSHFVPVVCRETPVLPVCREGIRRSPGLGIHIEEFTVHPRIRTCPAYAYRKITLEDDSAGMCIIPGFRKLHMQMILHKTVISGLLPVRGNIGADLFPVIDRIILPGIPLSGSALPH